MYFLKYRVYRISFPGAGLLAALNSQKSEAKDVSGSMDSKFGARSSAVMAVEQAVAAGDETRGASDHGKRPRGRVIQQQQVKGDDLTEYVIQLDDPFQENEEAQDLACAPITRVASDYREEHFRQVAVSDEYITYGLKQGHIRVLHRFSEARALLKGHSGLVADVCFVGNDTLVAGGQNGTLIAWQLKVQDGDNAIHATQILHITFSPGCETVPVLLSAAMKTVFATVGNSVVAFDLSKDVHKDSTESVDNTIDVDPLDPVPGMRVPNFPPQDVVAAIDVRPRQGGSIDVAIGSQRGRVYVATKNSDGRITPWETIVHEHGTSVSSVCWIDSGNEASLLVASADGRHVTVYESDRHGGHFEKGARIRLEPGPQKTASFINLQVVQERNILVLADVPRKSVYTLHYASYPKESSSSHKTCFDYFARFRVSMPVLNFFAMWNPDAEQVGDEGAIELNCVQTEAVQQYFVDPAMCLTSHKTSDRVGQQTGVEQQPEQEEREEENAGQEDEVCPSPPSTPAEPAVTVQVPFPVVLPTEKENNIQPPAQDGQRERPCNGDDSNAPQPRLLTPKDILERSTTPPQEPVASSSMETSQPPVPIPKILRRPSSTPSIPQEAQVSPSGTSTLSTSQYPLAVSGGKGDDEGKKAWGGSDYTGQQAVVTSLVLEMKRQAALQEATIKALISEALASQATRIAEERKAIIQEERAGMERLLAAVSNTLNRDLPARLGDIIREEVKGISSVLTTTLLPAMQEILTTTIAKEAPKNAAEDKKAVQTIMTKTIQDSFRHSFMKQIVPAFESATQNMFMQIDKALQKGLQDHLEASRSSLSDAVKTVIGSQEGMMMRSSSVDSTVQRSPLAGPTAVKAELTTLLGQGRFEDAFSKALSLQDVTIVSWLCTKVSQGTAIISSSPPALSQMVLLSLVQQLAADLGRGEHTYKLQWIREAALALNPRDSLLAPHIKPVLDQVYDALATSLGSMKEADKQSCKLAMHVVRSQMSTPL